MTDYEDAPWTADDRAELEADAARFRIHATAEIILAEFGGLHVGDNKPGIDHSRTDIRFDPTAAWGMDDLLDLPELRGRSVFPLGEEPMGMVLLLDSAGEAFLAMDEVDAHWPTFHAALYSLLLGRRRPVNTHGLAAPERPRPNVR